jgi:diacylglycerol O-acyltransferase
MDEQLNALDATFLELEEADLSAHMHIGGVMIFEPPSDGHVPSAEEACANLAGRLDQLPRYRQRLSEQTTGGISWPSWEDDPRFNLSGHIRRASLPGAGSEADLLEWAGEYFSERLDRSRPLWELVIIEGLSDGRWALVSKTHHCMVDGVGSVDAAHVLFDVQPNGSPSGDRVAAPPMQPPELSSPKSAGRAAAGGVLGLAKLPVRAGRAGLEMAGSSLGLIRHPSRAVDVVRSSRDMVELLIKDEFVAAPKTSINVPIGGRRRLAVTSVPLAELKGIKNTLGGTVNDVVLAVAAGGLRSLLLARNEEPPSPGLRAMVPVNLRAASEHLALGNKITTLFIHLPVAEPDPLKRFLIQTQEAESLKSGNQGAGSRTLIDFTAHAPPVLHTFLARSMYATRLFNLTITNVPGPQAKLYAFGSRMTDIWPIVPLAAEHAVGLAVLSYDGNVHFCLNADRDSMPDLDILADGMKSSFAELREVAANGDRP